MRVPLSRTQLVQPRIPIPRIEKPVSSRLNISKPSRMFCSSQSASTRAKYLTTVYETIVSALERSDLALVFNSKTECGDKKLQSHGFPRRPSLKPILERLEDENV